MITTEQAWAHIAGKPFLPVTEHVDLEYAAGRILAEDVFASRPFPAFDRVMMDGIALRYADLEKGNILELAGCVYAGQIPPELSMPRSCLEIMTGAVLPKGADTVVPIERLRIEGTRVTIEGEVKHGAHIHSEGSDRLKGAKLLEAGTRIQAGTTGVLASEGYGEVPVLSLPRCTIVSTGDELVQVFESPAPHQIRSSNREVLRHILGSAGIQANLLHLPDDLPSMTPALKQALAHSDLVLLSGGVSKGKKDHVPDALETLGATVVFHRVAQRPGKPMLFATCNTTAIFGLPGNPLSATFSAVRYVLPWLAHSLGQLKPPPLVHLSGPLRFEPKLTRMCPVRLSNTEGRLMAEPLAHRGSGDLASLSEADGIVELQADLTDFETGMPLPYFPFS